MSRRMQKIASPALLAGLAFFAFALPARAGQDAFVLPDVSRVSAGLFCAPPTAGRRDAPGTIAGWVHVPEAPVRLIADKESTVSPVRHGVHMAGSVLRLPVLHRLDRYRSQALLELENDPESSEEIDRVFRAFHTIKGVAGFMNLAPIVELTHITETLLDRLRQAKDKAEFDQFMTEQRTSALQGAAPATPPAAAPA